MSRRFFFSEDRPWYTESVLRRFFSPKVRKLYVVCSHHSPNEYLSISVIIRQWVCSPESNVRQDAHPTNRVHIFVNKGSKSVKLIYKERAVKLLIYGDFINEICDIIEIKRHYFTPNGHLVPLVGKRPTHIGLKCPPFGIWPRHVDKKSM